MQTRPSNEYLNRDLLHYQPVSAHLYSSVSNLGMTLHKSSSEEAWHGHLVRAVATVSIVAGYTCNSLIALVEGVAAFLIANVGLIIHAAIYSRSEMLQKHCVKMIAYAYQSFALLGLQGYAVYNHELPNSFFTQALKDQGIYIVSALAAHVSYGSAFDYFADRENLLEHQAVAIAREGGLPAVRTIITALSHDFDYNNNQFQDSFRSAIANFGDLETQLQSLPEFTWERLTDQDYRQQVIRVIYDYLIANQLIRHIEGDEEFYTFNEIHQQDTLYQNTLKGIIKGAFADLYKNPDYVIHFDDNKNEKERTVEQGRENMEAFSGEMVVALANYAQLKELESEQIFCPEEFGDKGIQSLCKERYQIIVKAKNLLKTLSEKERGQLVMVLIKGLEGQESNDFKTLYKLILEASGQIYQGKLMHQLGYDKNGVQTTLCQYQKVIQEAIEELTEQQA
jgi:hypothetical protein